MIVMKKIISLISAVLFVVMLGSCDTPEEVEDKPNIEDIINDKKVITRGGTIEEKEEEPKEEVLLEVSEEDADFVIEANGVKYNMVAFTNEQNILTEDLLPSNKIYDNYLVDLRALNNLKEGEQIAKYATNIEVSKNYVINTFYLRKHNAKNYGFYKIIKTNEDKYELYTLYETFVWYFVEGDITYNQYFYTIGIDTYTEITITLDTLPRELKKLVEEINS